MNDRLLKTLVEIQVRVQDERGANALEYFGMTALVLAVLAAATAFFDGASRSAIGEAVENVLETWINNLAG